MNLNLPAGVSIMILGMLCLLALTPDGIKIINALFKRKIPQKIPRLTKAFVFIAGLSLILLGIFSSNKALHPTCSYTGVAKTDPEAISWLIQQEAVATVSGDMDLIKEIFAEDARIVDYANRETPEFWSNPIDRYQQLFKDTQFIEDQNINIKAMGSVSGNTAYYISGSMGSFQYNGQVYTFVNSDDASHWTLTKINGCWKITKFEFNASGIKFP